MGTWLNQPIILSHYNWTLNGIEATSQQEVLISYREYHAGNCILSIWTSLPTRLLFDWPTVHPSNRSFVTIIIDSCPIFWTRFFNWKIPLLLSAVHYGLRLTEIVSIKCFEKLAHKSARFSGSNHLSTTKLRFLFFEISSSSLRLEKRFISGFSGVIPALQSIFNVLLNFEKEPASSLYEEPQLVH